MLFFYRTKSTQSNTQMNTQMNTQTYKVAHLEPITEEEEECKQQNFQKKKQKFTDILVTKDMLDAYMETHPYIYQEKPAEYADMTDDEWLETDKWADRASKMMVLSRQKK